MSNTNKQSFLKGALILSIAGIISKILGAVYRIPLGDLVTAEGMSYYQTAYLIYTLLLTFSASVIPIAISKLVSEQISLGRPDEANKIFKVAFVMLALLGFAFSALLVWTAKPLVIMLKNPDAYLAVLAIAPALLTVSLSSAFRGYFQGMQNMLPSGASQVTEQISRVGFGFAFVFLFIGMGMGIKQIAAGAILGTSIGGLISFLTVLWYYWKSRKQIRSSLEPFKNQKTESVGFIIKRILKFSIPIAIGGSIMPIMGLLDVPIVMARLQSSGFSYYDSKVLYGQLSGMAMSFINLPQVFSIALAASIVPTISESMARHDLQNVSKKTQLALRISMLIGLPAACGLFIMATPIMTMLYPNESATLPLALQYLAPACIFLTSVQTMTGVLQGMGRADIPVRNMIVGALAKVVVSFTLTAVPALNIRGAAIGTVVGYAVSMVLNIIAIKKYQEGNLNMFKIVSKPLVASIAMSVAAFFSYGFIHHYLGNTMSTLLAIAIAGLVYVIAIFAVKGISGEELDMIPGGGKIAKILKKRGYLE